MVTVAAVEAHNAHFARQKHAGKVGVFVGATNGIGEATLEVMASLLQASTLYVVGRSALRFERQRIRLKELNPTAKVVFIEDEITLIANVDKADSSHRESSVDYLYMSAGYLPVAGPEFTPEGVEASFSLSYFARMRFISNLLPLLRKSPSPRVLSVLNGGKEKKLDEDDLGLEKNWDTWAMVGHSTTMGTLCMYHLSELERAISFIHAFPGFVNTYSPRRRETPPAAGLLSSAWMYVISGVMTIVWAFLAISASKSGKRQAYHLTSERFMPGMWLVDNKCEAWQDTSHTILVEDYREKQWPSRIWDYTVGVWERALKD